MLKLYAIISAACAAMTALLGARTGFALFWRMPLSFFSTFLGLIVLQCLVFAVSVLLVNVNKSPKYVNYYRFSVITLLNLLVPLLRVKVHSTGTDSVPRDCRFLLVCNHLHDVDPAVIMYCLPFLELGFIGKKEIYRDMKFIGKAMHALHGLPLDRENNRSAVLTINAAAEKIKNDETSMSIFPEGYVSVSGKFQEFRNGAFKIAKKAHCPIVVATLKNTKQVVKNMFLRTTHVYFDVLDVIDTQTVDALTTAELSEQIHATMAENLE